MSTGQKENNHRLSLTLIEVMTCLVLTPDIPHGEADVLVFNSFNIKSCKHIKGKFQNIVKNPIYQIERQKIAVTGPGKSRNQTRNARKVPFREG